jgi:hypothetical protein
VIAMSLVWPASAAAVMASRRYGPQFRLPPVHRQVHAASGEFRLERRLQRAVLAVDRAHPVERTVVSGDRLKPLLRDTATAGDVAQERDDVVLALRTTETCKQDGVVCRRGGLGRLVGFSAHAVILPRPAAFA